jgi:hypothetical protein
LISENISWLGKWKIEIIDTLTGKVKETVDIDNRIMDAGLNEISKALTIGGANIGIRYMALGSSSLAIADNQTQLGAEIFRTIPIEQLNGSTGTITTRFIVQDNEAVGTINEIGIFGGTGATASANTGTMFSRILFSREKTASEQIQFTRTDRVVR